MKRPSFAWLAHPNWTGLAALVVVLTAIVGLIHWLSGSGDHTAGSGAATTVASTSTQQITAPTTTSPKPPKRRHHPSSTKSPSKTTTRRSETTRVRTTTVVVVKVVPQQTSVPVSTGSTRPTQPKAPVNRPPHIELRQLAQVFTDETAPACATAYDPDGHGVVVIFRPKLGSVTPASRSASDPRVWCSTYTPPSTDGAEIETIVATVTDGVLTRSATERFAVEPPPKRP